MNINNVKNVVSSIKPFVTKDSRVQIDRHTVRYEQDGAIVSVNILGELLAYDALELPFSTFEKITAVAEEYIHFEQISGDRYKVNSWKYDAEITATDVHYVLQESTANYNSIGWMNTSWLQSMIKRALPYASTDVHRPSINSIHYYSDGSRTAYIEATDGYQFLRQSIAPEDMAYFNIKQADFVLDAKHAAGLLKVLSKADKNVYMYTHKHKNQVMFEMFDDRFTYYYVFDMVICTYPDTSFIMQSKPSNFEMFVSSDALMDVIKRVNKIKSSETDAVTFMYTHATGETKVIYDSELDLSGDMHTFDLDSALVKHNKTGEDVVFGCKVGLLMNAIKAFNAQNITISGRSYNEPLKIGCTMRNDKGVYTMDTIVIMPNATLRASQYYGR